jgi:SRSO17 transposase
MNRRELERLGRELREYLDTMTVEMGRPERRSAMRAYVTGLLLDGERKSVEPMASRLVDSVEEIEAMRQRLLGCVAESKWADEEVRRRLALKLERELPGVEALVVDDTGFPKKGVHSVGVARQYSGTLGRTDNCQVATSLHLASEAGSGCIGLSLYLSEKWAADLPRRRKVGVPPEVEFRRKWEISLSQIDDALRWGVRKHVVLADAGYGDANEFRSGLLSRGLDYVVGVSGTAVVWPPESNPQIPPRAASAHGRPRTRYIDRKLPPVAMSVLGQRLSYRNVKWRSGSRGVQSSRFAATRIRTAHKHTNGAPPSAPQWLVCEWPAGEAAPTKFYLSSLPPKTSLKALVRLAKLRWRIERDYQELKQELGLDHFEGRSWRGFHHHATLCSVAHGFLALRRALFPPELHQMDPADGSTGPSVRTPLAAGQLSPLPADLQSWRASSGPLAAVTEAIE